MNITVRGLQKNLHSGIYGGVVREPIKDLVQVLSSLTQSEDALVSSVENQSNSSNSVQESRPVLIDGFYDDVRPVTQEVSVAQPALASSQSPMLRLDF